MEPATISPIRTTIAAAPNAATYFSRRDITHHNRTTHADVPLGTVGQASWPCPSELRSDFLPPSSPTPPHSRLVLTLRVRHLLIVCAAVPPHSRVYQIGILRKRPVYGEQTWENKMRTVIRHALAGLMIVGLAGVAIAQKKELT